MPKLPKSQPSINEVTAIVDESIPSISREDDESHLKMEYVGGEDQGEVILDTLDTIYNNIQRMNGYWRIP